MILLDANLLLYAYSAGAKQQARAAAWLTETLEQAEPIGLPWVSIWAFLRISTNPRALDRALDAETAFSVIREWLSQPGVITVQPGPQHAAILQRLVQTCDAAGPLLTDAVLAALAIENGAVLASSDQDFRRFPELKWINPMAPRHGAER